MTTNSFNRQRPDSLEARADTETREKIKLGRREADLEASMMDSWAGRGFVSGSESFVGRRVVET
jgi:hypothetical protein